MEISEGEEREKGTEEIFEAIISENSPELTPDTKCRSRKLKGHQVRVNFPKKTILSYPNHRKLKDKENSLNKPEKRKKQTFMYSRARVRITLPSKKLFMQKESG
jgi:hypothetical protein